MKLSKKGKAVYTEVGFWLEKDGSIQVDPNDWTVGQQI